MSEGLKEREFEWEIIPYEADLDVEPEPLFYLWRGESRVANTGRVLHVSNTQDPVESIEFETREDLKVFIALLQRAYEDFDR